MFYFCYLLYTALAGITIWSPDSIAGTNEKVVLSQFGDPFIFPQYGIVKIIQNNKNCIVPWQKLTQPTFLVLSGFGGCYFSDLAYSAQSLGAIGVIFPVRDYFLTLKLQPKNATSGQSLNKQFGLQ